MSLSAGSRLGAYEILAPLGAGGMGEVYCARDPRLERQVAIKVLPQAVAGDPERLSRFEREAKVLAALHHPHIAVLHAFETAAEGSTPFLVMELVEGPTLADRLAGGALPLDEALALAREIASALEYAHERGVVHRDLKPANVKLSRDGAVKVLDFGLAKALAPETPESGEADLTHSPTLTQEGTRAGILLGTAAYMSPEQARGKSADRRADVWAFGCVLYEMLTGRRAFAGETVADTLAAILKSEVDWGALPAETPGQVWRLLRRCLAKDPARRLRDLGDARLEIEEALAAPTVEETPAPSPVAAPARRPAAWSDRWSSPWAVAAWAVLGLVLAAPWIWRSVFDRAAPPRAAAAVRLAWNLPPGAALPMTEEESPMVAIAPDGSLLAASLVVGGGEQRIYIRSLATLETRALPGTERGYNPFFSHDGRWLGFFADGKLKKTPTAGGTVVTLADAADSRGATWLPDDTILFSPGTSVGLSRVPAGGGTPATATTLDPERGERTHRWPHALPGGEAALFTVGTAESPESYEDSPIDAVELATGRRVRVLEGASMAAYLAPAGQLVFGRGGTLFAVPFDARALRTTGPPHPVLPGVLSAIDTGAVHFAVADDGMLVYATGGTNVAQSRFAWQSRRGEIELLPLPAANYAAFSLSPDGRRIAVEVEGGRVNEIWIHDLERGTSSRLTFDVNAHVPLWMPDGERVVFVATEPGPEGVRLLAARADGSGEAEELLVTSQRGLFPYSVSSDGTRLLYNAEVPGSQAAIFSLPLTGERVPEPFVSTPGDEGLAAFSPDGHLVAYASSESGRFEVYVRPFPGPGGRWQVTSGGGSEPRWSASGRELFYRGPAGIEVVAVDTSAGFAAGAPQRLPGPARWATRADIYYNVAPDGERFLVLRPASEEVAPTELVVVLRWGEEVRRLVGETGGFAAAGSSLQIAQ